MFACKKDNASAGREIYREGKRERERESVKKNARERAQAALAEERAPDRCVVSERTPFRDAFSAPRREHAHRRDWATNTDCCAVAALRVVAGQK